MAKRSREPRTGLQNMLEREQRIKDAIAIFGAQGIEIKKVGDHYVCDSRRMTSSDVLAMALEHGVLTHIDF